MQLFYHQELTGKQKQIDFDKDESRHITRVLRKKIGDELLVSNGEGLLARVVLSNVETRRCMGVIRSVEGIPALPYRLHMAVAPTKSNERFEWFVEKATEIGVSRITPVICAHSERRTLKLERAQRVAIAAMKQSQRAWLPEIGPVVMLQDFLKAGQSETFRGIAHCQDGVKSSLKSKLKPGDSCCLLIGPEGDFSPEELALATENGYLPVSLGNQRLRTETAALAACHSVAFINEH